ncbi:CHAT domain-containing protein [uncultured Tenacibaculum sp.]|uniref:CHAT domain-containing protein n=1 Tax=uncultured Tenacibaculum sp. TaxID=174713 RepID=UPI002611BC2B|nr:CHAT domain-containing protein [uncultured Tenacibaculum sp.]
MRGQSIIDSEPNFNETQADSQLTILVNDTLKLTKKTHFFSDFFLKKKKYKLAVKYLKKEINILKKLEKIDSYYHKSILRLGYFYFKIKDIKTAISIFYEASNLSIDMKRKGQALCFLGRCFYLKGDYSKSLNYYDKGINLLKIHGKPTSIIAHSLNASKNSNFTLDKKSISKSIEYLRLADSLIGKKPKTLDNKKLKIKINLLLANINSQKIINNFKKANYYYRIALLKASQINDIDISATILRNQGEYYLELKKDSTLYFLQKSLSFCDQLNFKDSRLTKANAYLDLSDYYYYKKKHDKALENSYLALDLFYTSNNHEFRKTYPDVLHEKNDRKYSSLLTYKFNLKSLIALIQTSDEKKKYINEAVLAIKNFDNLISVVLDNDTNSESLFRWRKDASEIYNYAAYIYFLKKDYQSAFKYIEKNKSFLLAQSIDNKNINKELPDSILQKDKNHKKQILDLEYKLIDNDQQSVKDSLFNFRFEYQKFKDSIRVVFPNYFKLKSKTDLISLDKVKQQLNKDQFIISYSIQNSEEENYVNTSIGLLISKNKTIPFAISNIDTLQKNLNLYRKLIAKPLNTKKEINKFNKVSHYLYQNLFPTKEIQKLIKGKQLTIIPDNQLQNIPFEAFITDTSSNSYLIEDNDISYAYSMSFSEINNNIERTQTKEFAGFAPINFENQKLTSLEYSEKEINTISDNLNGLSLTGNSVTKDSFFKNAADAKIIHLATHADVSKKPVVHFSKDSLNLHELYTYKNNADLVVLSACETNLGELKKGEGILNLARGFFYSGSKSVVSSLWKVNDVATTSLMTDFYTNLKDHQSKSEALNNAKRNYLKTHTLSEKSPYYWASFILIGDTAPTFKSDYTLYYVIGFFVLSLLFLFFFKKRG